MPLNVQVIVSALDRLTGPVSGMSATMKGFRTAGAWMMGAGAAISGTLTAAAQAAANYGDAIGEMSQRVGASTRYLQGMKYAADQTGSSLEMVEMGLRRVGRMATEASQGNKAAQEAFDRLGIRVTDANGKLKSAETLMDEVGEALRGMTDKTAQGAAAWDLFGKGGAALIPIFTDATKSAQDFRKEAEALGLVMSPESVAAAGQYADTVQRMKDVLAASFREIGSAAIPTLEKIIELVVKNSAAFNRWSQSHKEAAGTLGTLAAVGAPVMQFLGAYFWMLPSWAQGFKMIGAGAKVAATAFGIVGTAIKALPLWAIVAVLGLVASQVLNVVEAVKALGTESIWKTIGRLITDNLLGTLTAVWRLVRWLLGFIDKAAQAKMPKTPGEWIWGKPGVATPAAAPGTAAGGLGAPDTSALRQQAEATTAAAEKQKVAGETQQVAADKIDAAGDKQLQASTTLADLVAQANAPGPINQEQWNQQWTAAGGTGEIFAALQQKYEPTGYVKATDRAGNVTYTPNYADYSDTGRRVVIPQAGVAAGEGMRYPEGFGLGPKGAELPWAAAMKPVSGWPYDPAFRRWGVPGYQGAPPLFAGAGATGGVGRGVRLTGPRDFGGPPIQRHEVAVIIRGENIDGAAVARDPAVRAAIRDGVAQKMEKMGVRARFP